MYLWGLVFLYFIISGFEKPVGFAVWKICLLITAVVTVIVLRCLANYGEGMLAAKLLPTLQMLERVSFTGVFLTRQDLLLLWFWMASAVLFLSGVVFFGSLLGTQLCRQAEKKRKLWLWVVLAALFALSFLPESLMAGTASAACRFALAESGVSGGTAGFIALACRKGEKKDV